MANKPLAYTMSAPFKSSPVEFNQRLLFPSNIFDLLPKDHECFLYADLVAILVRFKFGLRNF
jgi:hypothetical protein